IVMLLLVVIRLTLQTLDYLELKYCSQLTQRTMR
ncbi:uncharacterized protein METZ01_LOCUS185455, partial [marine metagenome]